MGVSLEKLLSYSGNKYIFTKAAMKAIERIQNVKGQEKVPDENEKVVIKTLNSLLEDKVKFIYNKDEDQ